MAYGCGAREILGQAPPSSFCTERWGTSRSSCASQDDEVVVLHLKIYQIPRKSSVLQVSQDSFLGAARLDRDKFIALLSQA
jgi:hypothetical protein